VPNVPRAATLRVSMCAIQGMRMRNVLFTGDADLLRSLRHVGGVCGLGVEIEVFDLVGALSMVEMECGLG